MEKKYLYIVIVLLSFALLVLIINISLNEPSQDNIAVESNLENNDSIQEEESADKHIVPNSEKDGGMGESESAKKEKDIESTEKVTSVKDINQDISVEEIKKLLGAWSLEKIYDSPKDVLLKDRSMELSGYAVVSGIVSESPIVIRLCFNVEGKTQYNIPRLGFDQRDPWFCFKNQTEAREYLQEGEQATIVISDYSLTRAAKEGSDMTTFVYRIK